MNYSCRSNSNETEGRRLQRTNKQKSHFCRFFVCQAASFIILLQNHHFFKKRSTRLFLYGSRQGHWLLLSAKQALLYGFINADTLNDSKVLFFNGGDLKFTIHLRNQTCYGYEGLITHNCSTKLATQLYQSNYTCS